MLVLTTLSSLTPHLRTEPQKQIVNIEPRLLIFPGRLATRGTSWVRTHVASVGMLVLHYFRLGWRIFFCASEATLTACRIAATLATPCAL